MGEAPQDVTPKEMNPGVQEPINRLSWDMILLQIWRIGCQARPFPTRKDKHLHLVMLRVWGYQHNQLIKTSKTKSCSLDCLNAVSMSESQSPPSTWVGKAFPAATFPDCISISHSRALMDSGGAMLGIPLVKIPNAKGKKKAGLLSFLGPSPQNGPYKVYGVAPPDMVEMHTDVCCEFFYCMHNILNVKAKVVIWKSFHFYIS